MSAQHFSPAPESKSGDKGLGSRIWTAFNGMCMAMADSVPGVSGGTVAFIMGFYENLVDSLDDLMHGGGEGRGPAARYLVNLGIGWVLGLGTALLVLSHALESQIYVLCSAFLGLTIVAIPLILRREREVMRGHAGLVVFSLIGVAFVAGASILRTSAGGGSIDFAALGVPQLLYLVLAGFCTICAMVLPGISGSSLLLIFGVYGPAVLAIKSFLTGQLAVAPGIAALAVGALVGLVVAVGAVKRALENHRAATMYLIVGLMVGSLVAIVLGPTTMATAQPMLSLETFSIPGFVVGAAILVALEYTRVVREHRDGEEA